MSTHTTLLFVWKHILFCVFCPNFLTKRSKTGRLSITNGSFPSKTLRFQIRNFWKQRSIVLVWTAKMQLPITGWHHSRYNRRWYIASATEACTCATDSKKVRKKVWERKTSFDYLCHFLVWTQIYTLKRVGFENALLWTGNNIRDVREFSNLKQPVSLVCGFIELNVLYVCMLASGWWKLLWIRDFWSKCFVASQHFATQLNKSRRNHAWPITANVTSQSELKANTCNWSVQSAGKCSQARPREGWFRLGSRLIDGINNMLIPFGKAKIA